MCEGDRLFGALDRDPCIPDRHVRAELDLLDLQTEDGLFDMPPAQPFGGAGKVWKRHQPQDAAQRRAA